MCTHGHHNGRRAIAIADGKRHADDHATWTRRDFLTQTAAIAGGAAFMLGGMPAFAASHSPFLNALASTPTDRSLVLIQLAGGNDGFNMVVPVTDANYHAARPILRLGASQTVALAGSSDFALNPGMSALGSRWADGGMAIVHGVGYPDHSLSHFRSTDIWASASPSNQSWRDGWTGRYVDQAFPDHISNPPEFPVAVRIGGASATLLRGQAGALGMSFSDAGQVERLATTGQFFDEGNVPDTAYGAELSFLRGVYNSGLRYRDAVVSAAQAGANTADYPGQSLAQSLAAVARLIKGGLGSRLYVVQLGGFDTHANQMANHESLLRTLSESVTAFYDDLAADGHGERVLTMTFSEFGRRLGENGAAGTDHGTAAPLMVFGGTVAGGFYGPPANLAALDPNGNPAHTTDFRQIYADVLTSWFGLEASATASVLGGSFSPLGFLGSAPTSTAAQPGGTDLRLDGVAPNPIRRTGRVQFALGRPQSIRLSLVDPRGRTVRSLADGAFPAGAHAIQLDATGLAAGTYLLLLSSEAGRETRPVTIVR